MTPISHSFPGNTKLSVVLDEMATHKRSCAIVIEQQKPVGIITERDIVRIFAQQLLDNNLNDMPVSSVMTAEPVCISETSPLNDALILARSRQFRHLLVLDEQSQLSGLITQSDMTKAHVELIEQQTRLQKENHALQTLSHQDSLMGIPNRRAMEVELDYMQAAIKRYNNPFSIALIDVDYFKRYNDFYGHQQGDQALIFIARSIEENLRQTDRLFRYGGEELLLLLPETDLSSAQKLTERICEDVTARGYEHAGCPNNILTISIGVTQACTEHWHHAVERADKALYKAKNNGRGRVCIQSIKN